MADFDTWATVLRMEADLRTRAIARRAQLGPPPAHDRGASKLRRAVLRLLRRLLRRPAPALPAATGAERRSRAACHGRTLPARRPCRVCGARGHGAAAFRPGYRPKRCTPRIARGKSRI